MTTTCSSQWLSGKWLASYNLHHHCNTHMLWDWGEAALKAVLNTFGMHHMTHSMATRYGSHETEDSPATQDSSPLDLMPQDHPMPEGDNDSSDKYCEETDTHHPLADPLEQFQQIKNQFASLKSTTPQSTPPKSCCRSQINYSTSPWHSNQLPLSSEEPVHKTM